MTGQGTGCRYSTEGRREHAAFADHMSNEGHIEWIPSDVSDWGDRPPITYDDTEEAREATREHQRRLREQGIELMTPEEDELTGIAERPAHLQPPVDEFRRGLHAAFDAYLTAYEAKGGHGYHGFTEVGDPKNYKGPLIWSEGDCAFRFASELEKRFPEMVHLELAVGKAHFADFDKTLDPHQFIDIVVTDMGRFDVDTHEFARWRHGMFIEVKYIPIRHGRWLRDSYRTVAAILRDANRLKTHLNRSSRCVGGAVLVVDDDDVFERTVFKREFDERSQKMFQPPAFKWPEWPAEVELLLISKRQTARRRNIGGELPISCPTCGSPRVARVAYGYPSPALNEASERGEVLLGGCLVSGDSSDPPWACVDCGYRPPA